MIQIEISPTSEHERYDVQLEGTTYTLDLDWNERAGLWFISISVATDTGPRYLMRSCPCVVGLPLTMGLVDDSWTGGGLTVEGDRDPEFLDWGTHAKLYYATAEELVGVADLYR